MRLTTAHEHPTALVARFAAALSEQVGVEIVVRSDVSEDERAAAYVNHGRWMIDCPFGCGAAQEADPTWPLTLCPNCWNAAVDGRWVRVEWPDEQTADEIERCLLVRPDEQTRNWYPHETVATLCEENVWYGVTADATVPTDKAVAAVVPLNTDGMVVSPTSGLVVPAGMLRGDA